jgi:OOP family OmpA-OmpF porin
MTKRFNPPSARRLSAVAIAAALAAFAGVAGAQTRAAPTHPGYVTNASGDIVKSAFGGCVISGQASAKTHGACPPATTASASAVAAQPRTQMAQATAAPAGREATVRSAATGGTAPSKLPGYAVASDGQVVLSGFGQCVRSGHWTAAHAAEPCDRVARAEVAPPPVAVAPAPEPKLEPAPPPPPAPIAQPAPPPAPVAAPEPPRPVIQKLTLATDVLFDFNKSELKESGKKRLDDLAAQIKDANVDEIIAIGHADRIASEDYNQKLSEERAQAVKDYLASKVANANKVTAQGKGESAPVTGDDCKKMGPETAANKKLVACLQPDRRVEIEVLGSRQLAGEAPAAGGATSAPAATGGSPAPSGGEKKN